MLFTVSQQAHKEIVCVHLNVNGAVFFCSLDSCVIVQLCWSFEILFTLFSAIVAWIQQIMLHVIWFSDYNFPTVCCIGGLCVVLVIMSK